MRYLLIVLLLVMCATHSESAELSATRLDQGLDEQIQEIKSEVLAISAELDLLEEKLLYPSHSQVALFISLESEESFRLDSVSIEIDGTYAAEHIYSHKELMALRKGGVQRIFEGNLKQGKHRCLVRYQGQSEGGNDFTREQTFVFDKGLKPGMGEIVISYQSAAYRDR